MIDDMALFETIDVQRISHFDVEALLDYLVSLNAISESEEEVSIDLIVFLSNPKAPLYDGCLTSSQSAAKLILSLAVEFNLPQSTIDSLLTIIKSLLPIPNLLLTVYDGIMKSPVNDFGHYTIKYFCNHCNPPCLINSGKTRRRKERCSFMNKMLASRDMNEIVITFDLKNQLKSIISRNQSVFGEVKDFKPFDIHSGLYYQDSTSFISLIKKNDENPVITVTINIHTDDAPLVPTSKASLWPCMGSMVELPPHIREQQGNIIILALWISSVRPDVDLFMQDSIQQLLNMSICSLIY